MSHGAGAFSGYGDAKVQLIQAKALFQIVSN